MNFSTTEDRLGFIYLIEHDYALKVGFSDNPKNRLFSLQTANYLPLRLVAQYGASFADEQRFHRNFKDQSLGNEWYPLNIKPAASEYLLKLCKSSPELVTKVDKAAYVRKFVDVDGMLSCQDLIHWQSGPLQKLVEFGSNPETISVLGFAPVEYESIKYFKKILALYGYGLKIFDTLREGKLSMHRYRIVKIKS